MISLHYASLPRGPLRIMVVCELRSLTRPTPWKKPVSIVSRLTTVYGWCEGADYRRGTASLWCAARCYGTRRCWSDDPSRGSACGCPVLPPAPRGFFAPAIDHDHM